MSALITQARIPVKDRPQGYYLRWWYNGWHYWQFILGSLQMETAGEGYRTFSKKVVRLNSGQLTAPQIEALRTVINTTEVYLYTIYGWMLCRIDAGSVIVYKSDFDGYEFEFNMTIGSKLPSSTGFSPQEIIPITPPAPQCELIIGAQIWLCKNWDAAFPASRVYGNDEANRAVYGGLYTHDQIMSTGFCPEGWRIPTEDDWDELIDYVGDLTDAGGKLKEVGITHWNTPNTDATDDYDFAALPAGFFFLGYNEIGETAYFWSTKTSSYLFRTAQAYRMKYDSAEVSKHQLALGFYCSVRFIKDTNILSTGEPTDVTANAISDTEVTISWTNNLAGATANNIYYSTDGISFVLHGTALGADTTYQATGLSAKRHYYFQVRAAIGSILTEASATADDWTAMRLPLESTGTGLGVSTIRLRTTGARTIEITGTGKFYSDAAGTLNESTTKPLTADAVTTWYVRLPSGTADIYVFHKNDLTEFGTYLGSQLGWNGSTNSVRLKNMNVTQLPRTLIKIAISGLNTVTGTIANLPPLLTDLYVSGQNTLSGDIIDLPVNMFYLTVTGSNTITGDITHFTSDMIYIQIQGVNTLYGNLANLKSKTVFYVYGANTITGVVGSWVNIITSFQCFGVNTISGDIGGIPASVTFFILIGNNTVNGDLADLPAALNYFRIEGNNQITNYTVGRVWTALQNVVVNPSVGYGLSASEVDNFLIDVSAATWSGLKELELKGSNATRTSASDAAIATLLGKGVTLDLY